MHYNLGMHTKVAPPLIISLHMAGHSCCMNCKLYIVRLHIGSFCRVVLWISLRLPSDLLYSLNCHVKSSVALA